MLFGESLGRQAKEGRTIIDFPIVDTHVHIWDINKLRYPWLSDFPFLNKTFLPEDYRKACGPINVEKMIFVQCECDPAQYKEEVAWITELAQTEKRFQGIVAWAPCEKGEAVRPELEELAQNELVKGIRRIIQFEEGLEFCLRPGFIKGVQLLAEFGFTFDICIAHYQTASTTGFVRQCPDVKFILDHIGTPNIKEGMLDPWRAELREFSKLPNVYCKVSSLATEADHHNWFKEELKPYVDHIFECFGFDRTIYGGDWPVSSQAATLPQCVETLEWLIKGCSQTELKKLFHDNAIAFYDL